MKNQPPGRYLAALGAVTAATLVSRVAWLGTVPGFWGDEAFDAVQVRKPLGAMLEVVRHDSHPPLLYLLQHTVAMVSSSPAALRLVSALSGTAAVLLAAALGRRLAGDRGGLLAAAVLASFPNFLLSSRDARGYALATSLVLASALAIWRASEQPDGRRLLVYGVVVAAAVYTHYFSTIAVVSQLLAALAWLRPPRRVAVRLVAACAVGGCSLLPWLLVALPQFQHVGSPFWVRPIHSGNLVADVLTGLRQTSAAELAGLGAWLAELAVLPLLLLLYRRSSPALRPAVLFLLSCAVLPTLVLLGISLWKPVYDARFAAIFWGPGEALVGASLTMLRPRLLAPLACAALAVVAIGGLLQVHRPSFEAVVAPLDGRVRPGDVVALDGPDHYFSIAYAADARTVAALRVVADSVPWYFGTAGYPPGTEVKQAPETTGTIYVVNDAGAKPLPLPSGFALRRRQCTDGICVSSYSR
ncbi:MAG: glycosyltransferase family 39 protein [Candidatus Dormibacteria bacterium]